MSVNIERNPNALRAYREINALENKTGVKHGLTKDQLKAIAFYIETELPAQIQQGNFYLKKDVTGLARTIEYDPETKRTYIHLKHKGGLTELGRGGAKVVTQSILYDVRKPEYVANSIFKKDGGSQKEIDYMLSLRGSSGIMELLSVSSHYKEKALHEVCSITTPLYRHGSLKQFMHKSPMAYTDKAGMAKDVMNSLKSLHARGIAHGDVHNGNFLVADRPDDGCSKYQAIMTDFGTAHFADEKSISHDVRWAGCMLYELFHNSHRIPSHWVGTLTPAAIARKDLLNLKIDRTPLEEFERLLLSMVEASGPECSAEFYEFAFDEVFNRLKSEPVEKSLNKQNLKDRALGVYREINALKIPHGLNREELIRICEYIELDLLRHVQNGELYLKKEKTGLPRTIEYDAETGQVFIHLKRKGVKELGRGGLKTVTTSIVYGMKPRFVATSVCAASSSNQREIDFMRELKDIPGIVELLSASTHIQRKTGKEVLQITTPLYRYGSLKSLRENTKLTLAEKISLTNDILEELASMHSKGIVHGDVHDGNFLIDKRTANDSPFRAILADLGTASLNAHNPLFVTKDFFAAGCMFYEILHDTHRLPQHWDKLNLFPRLNPQNLSPGTLLLGSLGEATARWQHLCTKLETSSLTQAEQYEWQILELMHPRA